MALPEGSLPEEHITFEKRLEDNPKVRSMILASMSNNIHKQYDRLDDVPSILLPQLAYSEDEVSMSLN